MKLKNRYSYFLILLFCCILCACSTKVPITKWANSGQISGTLWYIPNSNDNDKSAITIPLLVRAEWENTPIQKGNLALVFVHGSLFAKCSYANSRLICETKSSFPRAKVIATNCAMLISATINDLQGMPMNLPPQWNIAKTFEHEDKNNKTPNIYVFQHKNIKVKFEIVEAIW